MVRSVYSLSVSPGQARERKEQRREKEFGEEPFEIKRPCYLQVGLQQLVEKKR